MQVVELSSRETSLEIGMLAQILADRLKTLDWTEYRLTREYCRVRGWPTDPTTVNRYKKSVANTLKKPHRSSFEMINYLIQAMDGEQSIYWNNRQNVVVGREEVKVVLPPDDEGIDEIDGNEEDE